MSTSPSTVACKITLVKIKGHSNYDIKLKRIQIMILHLRHLV